MTRPAQIATGLLGLMAVLFVIFDILAQRYPAFAYARAFAEASLVGGLADWFAVTALFRRPLGLPIPHTAIVPENKERIASTLGQFLRNNFLVPGVLARRMEGIDFAGAAARRLLAPRKPGGRGAREIRELARDILNRVDEGAIVETLRQVARRQLAGADVPGAAAGLIDRTIEGERGDKLIDTVVRWVRKALTDNEALLRAQVTARVGWVLRMAKLDDDIADQLMSAMDGFLAEVAADPAHPARLKAAEALAEFTRDLRHDPEVRGRVDALVGRALASPQFDEWLLSAWASAKASLTEPARAGETGGGSAGALITGLAEKLRDDAALRETVNQFVRRAIVTGATRYGGEIVKIVTETVRGWEAETIVTRLQSVVGRDLQYIRINGTVVGGLAGLTIYTLSQAWK